MANQRFGVTLRQLAAPNQTLVVQPEDYEGTAESSVTIQQDTDSGLSYSYGSSLTFYNRAYDFIINELITSPNAPLNGVEVMIFDQCCKNPDGSDYLIFRGIIRRADIQLTTRPTDKACAVECDFSDYSATSAALNCLKEAVIFSRSYGANTSDGENQGRAAVFMAYYTEVRPRSFAAVLYFIGFFIAKLVSAFLQIITLNVLTFVNRGSILRDIEQDIANGFVRKKFHKTPFLGSYIRNGCKLCGLNLQSSLLAPNGFFENVVRLDAAITDGGNDVGEASSIYTDFNAPNITFVELFQQLRALNVRFWIQGGNTLVFERRDYQSSTWIDFTTRDADIQELVFSFGDEFPPAVRVYEYTNDLTDKVGQEAFRRISGLVVDYNQPPNPGLRGSQKVTLPYGAWRIIGDGLPSALNDLRNGTLNSLYQVNNGNLIMETGVAGVPKLLEYNPSSPINDAQIFDGNSRFFIEATRRSGRNANSIYPQLLEIDDPRLQNTPTQDFELTFTYTCDDLRNFDFNQTVLVPYIGGIVKRGVVTQLTINYTEGTATITGKI